MLSQEYQDIIVQKLFLHIVAWSLSDKIAQGFPYTVLSQEYSDNIAQDFVLCNVVWSL